MRRIILRYGWRILYEMELVGEIGGLDTNVEAALFLALQQGDLVDWRGERYYVSRKLLEMTKPPAEDLTLLIYLEQRGQS